MLATYILPMSLGVGSTLLFISAALHPVFTRSSKQEYLDTNAHSGGGAPQNLKMDYSFHALVVLGFALMFASSAFYTKYQMDLVVGNMNAVLTAVIPQIAGDINASITRVTVQSLGALHKVDLLDQLVQHNAKITGAKLQGMLDSMNHTMSNIDLTMRNLNGVIVGMGGASPPSVVPLNNAAQESRQQDSNVPESPIGGGEAPHLEGDLENGV